MLNRALDAREGLKKRGRFTESKSTRAALAELRAANRDPLGEWLEEATEEKPGSVVPVKELRAAYNEWAQKHKKPTLNQVQFGKQFSQLRPEVTKGKRGSKGAQEYAYVGIKRTDLAWG